MDCHVFNCVQVRGHEQVDLGEEWFTNVSQQPLRVDQLSKEDYSKEPEEETTMMIVIQTFFISIKNCLIQIDVGLTLGLKG